MGFAFTHLLAAWLAGKGFEKASGKKIKQFAWFLLLFGSVLPDADFLLDWTFGVRLHRTFTHSLLFAFLFPLALYIFAHLAKEKEKGTLSLALCAGILSHIFVDFFSFQGIPLFWPDLTYYSLFRVGAYSSAHAMLSGSYDSMKGVVKRAVLDMGLGTAWLLYLSLRRKIRF